MTNTLQVSPNATFVEFPMDYTAFTLRMRREGLKAASRVKGDKTKLDTMLTVLDILKAHAIAKFDEQTTEQVEPEEPEEPEVPEEPEQLDLFSGIDFGTPNAI